MIVLMTRTDINTRAVEAIRAEMGRRGIQQKDLAALIGRSPMWVSRRLSPRTAERAPIDLAELQLILDALDMGPTEVFGIPA